MRTVINRMRGENKNGREDGSAVGVGGQKPYNLSISKSVFISLKKVGGHSNGFTGSGDVDGGQDTKVRLYCRGLYNFQNSRFL